MGCGDEKLSKYLTQTFTAHCNAMICQQVTLSGDAEWPKVADAMIEAVFFIMRRQIAWLFWNRTLEFWDGVCVWHSARQCHGDGTSLRLRGHNLWVGRRP